MRKITRAYGQFIPTEVILGGRVYFRDDKLSSESSVNKSKEGSVDLSIGSSTAKIGGSSSDSKRKSNFYSFDYMRLFGGDLDGENFDEEVWIKSLKIMKLGNV